MRASSAWRAVRRPVLIVVASTLASLIGLAFAQDGATLVAPAAGVAVAALVLFGRRVWPAIAVGALAAHLIHGLAVHTSVVLAVGATLSPLAVHAVLERAGFQATLARTRDLIALVVSTGLAMTLSATLGSVVLVATDTTGPASLAGTWFVSWFGTVAGVLLVAPLILTLGAVPWHENRLRRRPWESILLIGALVGGTGLAVGTDTSIAYVLLLVGLLAAVRLEQPGAAVAAVIFTAFGIWATVDPARSAAGRDSLLLAQGLHLTLGLLLLSIGVVTRERRTSHEDLERAAAELEDRVELRTRDLAAAQRLAHIGSFSWDAATDTNTWSEELFRIYGLEAAAGAPTFKRYMGFVRPDHLERVQAAIQEALETGRTLSHTYPVTPPDGRERWVHAYVEIDRDDSGNVRGLHGTCQDVTDRQRADERLRSSEARFRGLLEAGPDAIVVADERGDIVLVNDETRRLFGYERDDLVGRCVDVLLPDGLREAHAAHRTGYIADPQRRPMGNGMDLSAVRKDGSLVPVDVSLSPVTTDGATYVIAAVRDATERRAMEGALRSAYEREHEAAEHLRELDVAKNAFLTAVSHELRTPLTSIVGFTELLRDADDADTGDIIDRLEANTRRLTSLLDDLLDLNRLQRGVLEPRRRRVSGETLVSAALRDIDLGERRLEVEVDGSEDAFVDAPQTERIIENLVHNAVKYGGTGPIHVHLSTHPGGGLGIHVADRGPGIPDDMKDRIFESFTRAHHGAYTQGTGVGLALVAQFAALHGGRAWVSDRPGGGSVFHVLLPSPLSSTDSSAA